MTVIYPGVTHFYYFYLMFVFGCIVKRLLSQHVQICTRGTHTQQQIVSRVKHHTTQKLVEKAKVTVFID